MAAASAVVAEERAAADSAVAAWRGVERVGGNDPPGSAFDDRAPGNRERGYVLIAVLIVIVVLSLVAYRFTDAMTSDYRASVRTSDMAQARAAAASGIHYTAACSADPTTRDQRSRRLASTTPALFQDIAVRTDSTNAEEGRLLLDHLRRQLRPASTSTALRRHR